MRTIIAYRITNPENGSEPQLIIDYVDRKLGMLTLALDLADVPTALRDRLVPTDDAELLELVAA